MLAHLARGHRHGLFPGRSPLPQTSNPGKKKTDDSLNFMIAKLQTNKPKQDDNHIILILYNINLPPAAVKLHWWANQELLKCWKRCRIDWSTCFLWEKSVDGAKLREGSHHRKCLWCPLWRKLPCSLKGSWVWNHMPSKTMAIEI